MTTNTRTGVLGASTFGARLALPSLAEAYFFLAPIPQTRALKIGPVSVAVAVAVAACAAGLISLVARPTIRRVFQLKAWALPLAAIAAATAIGALRAPPEASASIAYNVGAAAIPLVLISVAAARSRTLRRLLTAWIWGLSLAATIWVFNEVTGAAAGGANGETLSITMSHERSYEAGMWLGIQNMYGCMAMGIAAGMALAIGLSRASWRGRAAYLVLAAVLFVGQSRGGYMAATVLAIGSTVTALALSGRPSVAEIGRRLAAVGVLGALLYGGSEYLELGRTSQRLDVIRASGFAADASIAARWEGLARSMEAFSEHPVLGIGLRGWVDSAHDAISGHSSLLDVAAQLGLLGWAGYYGFMGVAFVALLRRRDAARARDAGVSAAAVVGLLFYAVGSSMNGVFLLPSMNETLLLVTAAALVLANEVAEASQRPGRTQGSGLAPLLQDAAIRPGAPGGA